MYTARRLRTMLKAYTTPKVCPALKQRIIQPPDNYSVMTSTSMKSSQRTYGASSTVATVVASPTKTIIAVTFGNEASRTGRIVISAASPSAAKVIEMLTSRAAGARSSTTYSLMRLILAKTISNPSAKALYTYKMLPHSTIPSHTPCPISSGLEEILQEANSFSDYVTGTVEACHLIVSCDHLEGNGGAKAMVVQKKLQEE
jgi:hypothetical protein